MTDAPADTLQPEFGPAMRALPNDRWRKFARALASGPQGHGKLVRAYRSSGFHAAPRNAAREAHTDVPGDDRVIAAVAEEVEEVPPRWSPRGGLCLVRHGSRSQAPRSCAGCCHGARSRSIRPRRQIHVVKTDMTGAAMIERIKELAKVLGIDAERAT